jgi:hypothetical protein
MAKPSDPQEFDLFDYVPARPVAVRRPRARPRSKPEPCAESQPIRVIDDWPALVPITEAEIRVVEAHLGDVLDELFGPLP